MTKRQVDPIDVFLKSIDAKNYKVSYGFISRNEDTKKLYNAEEVLSQQIFKVGLEHLRLLAKEDKKIKEVKTSELEAYADKEDCYTRFPKHCFSIGVTSALNSLMHSFDSKSVAVAFVQWATTRLRFSGEYPEEAVEAVRLLAKIYGITETEKNE